MTAATFTAVTPHAGVAAAPEGVDTVTGEVTGPAPVPDRTAAIDAMFAAFSAAGFASDARSAEGKEARRGYMSAVLGRDITATKELSADDVERVTDALAADAADKETS